MINVLALVILFCSCDPKKEGSKVVKPNIVFIFTGDQTYTSVHALGNDEIITPSLDKLVHEGTNLHMHTIWEHRMGRFVQHLEL